MKLRRILSFMMALLLVCSFPVSVFAAEYDLAQGSVIVNATETGQTVTHGSNAAVADDAPVITQSNSSTPTSNTVTITAAADTTANVTLSGVNIDTGTSGGAAVEIKGNGDVVIELDGSNTVQSGQKHAGVEKNDSTSTGNLTVTDENGTQGSLEATGGYHGAGIGGGEFVSGSNITITESAKVNAQGGDFGAGIGGGWRGSGSNITITGSAEVTATGGISGAGIGGGGGGSGSNIKISDTAEVTATGGYHGAGIGGGEFGSGSNITITGSAEVTANGGVEAAGIGGGDGGIGGGTYITITDSAGVKATGGEGGAGIGGGCGVSGSNIEISGSAEVTATGGISGAGIGGGYNGIGSDITISQNAQVKAQGGNRFHPDNHRYYYSAGAAIGNGGKGQEGSYPTPGSEVPPNTNDLDEGWIAKYAPGTTNLDTATPSSLTYKDNGQLTTSSNAVPVAKQEPTCTEDGHQAGFSVDGAVVAVTIPKTGHSFTNYIPDNNATYEKDGTKTAQCDHCDATDTIPDPGSRLVFLPGEYYKVIGKDGKTPPCKETNQNGVLTITADADFASLTGALSGMQALKGQGIDTIVFVTNGATSTFALSDLLAQGGDGYTLTHDGETVTFTLGNGADISEILK